jgi:succinate dehydrogenase/fumarate reductase-like Fe-S protein
LRFIDKSTPTTNIYPLPHMYVVKDLVPGTYSVVSAVMTFAST